MQRAILSKAPKRKVRVRARFFSRVKMCSSRAAHLASALLCAVFLGACATASAPTITLSSGERSYESSNIVVTFEGSVPDMRFAPLRRERAYWLRISALSLNDSTHLNLLEAAKLYPLSETVPGCVQKLLAIAHTPSRYASSCRQTTTASTSPRVRLIHTSLTTSATCSLAAAWPTTAVSLVLLLSRY